MFQNAIWKNPIGWASKMTEKRVFFWFIGLHIFVFITQVFVYTAFSLHIINLPGHTFGDVLNRIVLLSFPFLFMGVYLPLLYLFALRSSIKEIKKSQDVKR